MEILADLHTHSVSSGHAYSTVDELAKTASRRGLKAIALTDHGPNMPGGPHLHHLNNLVTLPDEIYGIRVIKGVEANILDSGKLDIPRELQDNLEFVAAGLHEVPGLHSVDKNILTKTVIAAMENSAVKMITHPVNKDFLLDLELLVPAAKRNGVLLELNAASYNPRKIEMRGIVPESIKLAKLAKKINVPLSLNSDAHFHSEVGEIAALKSIVERTGLEEKDIINCSSERTLNYLELSTENKMHVAGF